MARLAKPLPDSPTLADVASMWQRSLRADNKSPRTIQAYTYAMDRLVAHVGADRRIDLITRDDHETMLDGFLTAGWKPASVSTVYRPLRSFWKFVVQHDDLPVAKDPMNGMRPPFVPE